MAMEKFGVNNKVGQQQRELKQVKGKLSSLNGSMQKTAAQTQETERLEKRAIELQVAIAEQ